MKKIRIGIIGTGKLGVKHALNLAYRIPEAKLAAVCSLDPKERERAKDEWNVEAVYENFEEMLDHPGLDGVTVSSPSTYHYEHVMAAIRRGLHVIVEKPLGITREEIDTMCREAEKTDKVLMLAYMRRFDPSYVDAKRMIDAGAIGDVVMVKCNGLDPTSAWPGDTLYQYSRTNGGIFLDMAIHDFDLARWFLQCEPVSVYAMGGLFTFKELQEFNDFDNVGVAMQFENQKMALFHSGRTAAEGCHVETEIFGTKGAIRVSPVAAKNLNYIYDEHGVRQETYQWFKDRWEMAYLHEMQAFVNCILNKTPSPVTAFDGNQATRMAVACMESFTSKSVVHLK